MNDGHVLVSIIAAFIVAETIAFGVYQYLRAAARVKASEADASDLNLMAAAKKLERGD